jgi:hypothetical protein
MCDDGAKSALILCRSDEGADHAALVVRLDVVQDVEPEIIARLLRVSVQVTEVLHEHE